MAGCGLLLELVNFLRQATSRYFSMARRARWLSSQGSISLVLGIQALYSYSKGMPSMFWSAGRSRQMGLCNLLGQGKRSSQATCGSLH